MNGTAGYVTSVVADREGLAALQPDWDALYRSSAPSSPFTHHAWMSAWWDAYGGRRAPRVMTYRDAADGRLVGVVPLCEETSRLPWPMRRLRYLGGVAAAGLGPLTERSPDGGLVRHIAADLCVRRSVPWDVLDLRLMRDGEPFIEALREAGGDGCVVVEPGRHVCPRVGLPADWDTYLRSLSKGLRRKIRHYRAECGSAGFFVERIEDPNDLEPALDDLVRLFEARMRDKLGAGYTAHPSYRRFLLSVSRWMLAEGRLRLWFLTRRAEDGSPDRRAFVYQFRSGDTMYLMQQAYDPGLGALRLSTVLTSHAIEGAIAEGCTVFDFLLGADRHKFRWGVSEIPAFSDVRVYAPSASGRLCRRLDAASRAAAVLAKSTPLPVRTRLGSWVRAVRRAGER